VKLDHLEQLVAALRQRVECLFGAMQPMRQFFGMDVQKPFFEEQRLQLFDDALEPRRLRQ